MKNHVVALCLILAPFATQAQVGVSFSALFPNGGGQVSFPVSPVAIRGVSLMGTERVYLQTGISLYRMGGLPIQQNAIPISAPITKPFFGAFVPIEGAFALKLGDLTWAFTGGGWACANLGVKADDGSFDLALIKNGGWAIVNTKNTIKNHFMLGWIAGCEWIYYINKKMGITFDCKYLSGKGKADVEGQLNGLSNQGILSQRTYQDSNASIQLKGLEISVGATFKVK